MHPEKKISEIWCTIRRRDVPAPQRIMRTKQYKFAQTIRPHGYDSKAPTQKIIRTYLASKTSQQGWQKRYRAETWLILERNDRNLGENGLTYEHHDSTNPRLSSGLGKPRDHNNNAQKNSTRETWLTQNSKRHSHQSMLGLDDIPSLQNNCCTQEIQSVKILKQVLPCHHKHDKFFYILFSTRITAPSKYPLLHIQKLPISNSATACPGWENFHDDSL